MRRHVPSFTQRLVDIGCGGSFEPSVLSPLYGRGRDMHHGRDVYHGCGGERMLGMHGHGLISGASPNLSNVHGVHGMGHWDGARRGNRIP
eukprot:1855235-Amphidinium_carterae.1